MVDRLKHLPDWSVYALLAYMPFHIFLSQSLSLITGNLDAWKIAKDIIAASMLLVILAFVFLRRAYNKPFLILFSLGTAYLLLHLLVWAFNPDIYQETALLALLYNNRVVGFLLLGFGAGLLMRDRLREPVVIKIIIAVSTIVCVIGLLQYLLPKDIMTHFGYSLERGVRPAFFIDDKPDLPRVMSTLRDPNSLAGFLVIPITILVYRLLNSGRKRLTAALLGLHVLVLLLTFSRSGLLATIASLATLLVITNRRLLTGWLRKFWLPALVGAVLLFAAGYALRDQYFVQHFIFHSDESTTAELDSNDLHVEFAEKGLRGIFAEPFGHGPGTAGIVSIQNRAGGLLTENYFIQIGYEIGVLGLLLFLGIVAYTCWEVRTSQSHTKYILLSSMAGYALMAMLTHLWTNEAIAAQWWILAGIVLAARARESSEVES